MINKSAWNEWRWEQTLSVLPLFVTTTTLILGQGSLSHVHIVKYADMPAGAANFLDQAFVRTG